MTIWTAAASLSVHGTCHDQVYAEPFPGQTKLSFATDKSRSLAPWLACRPASVTEGRTRIQGAVELQDRAAYQQAEAQGTLPWYQQVYPT